MKTNGYAAGKNKSGKAYTNIKYDGDGQSSAPSYKDSIHSAGLPRAVVGQSVRVVRKINFRVLPLPGTVLMHQGQRYVVVGSDLHKRRDGQIVPIILWESHCAECGKPFQCRSGLRSGTLNRRCPDHHAPGKAVTRAGRKRVAKHLSKHGKRQEAAHD